MARVFSSPSVSVGVSRFAFGADGSDSWSHVDYKNFADKVDAMFGISSGGGAWPPTEGLDEGLFLLISLLQQERAPIGTTIMWFRPSLSVPMSYVTDLGWAVCDGSVVSDHDFPGGIGPVTLPNMINAFPLGANPATTIGQAGVAVGNANIDNIAGAPGPQGIGGSNQHTITQAELPDLNATTTAPNIGIMEDVGGDQHFGVYEGGPWSNNPTENHTHDIAISGGDLAHENRPRYVGLLFLTKVKYVSSL